MNNVAVRHLAVAVENSSVYLLCVNFATAMWRCGLQLEPTAKKRSRIDRCECTQFQKPVTESYTLIENFRVPFHFSLVFHRMLASTSIRLRAVATTGRRVAIAQRQSQSLGAVQVVRSKRTLTTSVAQTDRVSASLLSRLW